MTTPLQSDDIDKDLGLGTRVAQQSHLRFLNRDGSFNVGRRGLSFLQSLSPYHALLTMSWIKFFFLVAGSYFLTNIVFAAGYVFCGTEALRGVEAKSFIDRLSEAFFFSVQTVATIGYGKISPTGYAANILVTIESLVGLLGFALVTGLLFARFSRPDARIIFSKQAVIAPYRGITAFEFRIANERSNQLLEVEATVTLSRLETQNGQAVRKFHQLALEREKVVFMPLHWVIVHPIDQTSPLYGVMKKSFDASDAELLVQIKGVDETFSQTVHARSSYKCFEVVWGARFADMYLPPQNGILSIDLRNIDKIEIPYADPTNTATRENIQSRKTSS